MNRYEETRQIVLGALLGLTCLGLCNVGCSKSSDVREATSIEESSEARAEQEEAEKIAYIAKVRPQVEAFCGDCHAMPRPASTPREEWVQEVNQGFVLYGESGRNDLEVPDYEEVLKFFQFQAPEVVSLPESTLGYPPCPISFRAEAVRFPGPRPPGVTNVRWLDIGMNDANALVYCDIGTGAVLAHWPGADGGVTKRLATLFQPVHTEACDLDADGWIDLVVADIGEFNANDSELGRVVWLRRLPDTDKFETIDLMEGISRVADVQPGDFDGDGDTDVMVGIFGWRKTGRIVLLDNQGPDSDGVTRFQERDIDGRNGPSNVLPYDFNKDGKLDFIALISQEHEVIEVFINQGDATFERELIWAAPDPAYGSSGIDLVDMDLDGDIDILYTNGDSFDRGPKPHHSVQWLENRGDLPFIHHHLCDMPGVLNARAGDFDGDGDLDVVAASLLAGPIRKRLENSDTSSVVMLIQDQPGVFVPTQIEGSSHLHLSIAAADFDGNGKLDFAIGNYLKQASEGQPDLVVRWND